MGMKPGGMNARPWLLGVIGVLALSGCAREGAPNPDKDPYLAMNTLLVANACSNCHASDYPRVGPSMKDVAAVIGKPTPEGLARIRSGILSGTKGQWGEAIMPPQKQVTPEAADALARAILALAPDQ
jgi:cytochrome c551/c552